MHAGASTTFVGNKKNLGFQGFDDILGDDVLNIEIDDPNHIRSIVTVAECDKVKRGERVKEFHTPRALSTGSGAHETVSICGKSALAAFEASRDASVPRSRTVPRMLSREYGQQHALLLDRRHRDLRCK